MAAVFDAVGPSSSGQVSTASPTTWSHTNAGNCIVVIANWTSGGSSNITAVTYGGVSLSRIAQVAGGGGTAGGCDVWGVISGALPTGANTVSVTGGSPSASNHVCCGSISATGAGSFGTPVTGSATAGTLSATVTGTVSGGLIVAGATFGGSFVSATANSPGTLRFSALGDSNGGADQTFGQTATSPGGSQAVGFTWSSGSDFIGLAAVEIQPAASSPVIFAMPQMQRRKPYRGLRRQSQDLQPPKPPGQTTWTPAAALNGTGSITAAPTRQRAAAAALSGSGTMTAAGGYSLYITGLGGSGAGYFRDQNGTPRMWVGDEVWALLTNAGRWNSGNYQSTFDTYFAARAAQGFTVCYSDMFNSTFIGGATNGQMWNGQTPFTSNNPSSGLNNSYWQVIDYALNSALNHGITLALSFGGHWDWDTSGNAMNGFTGTQYQAAGNAIGTRYASQPNIVWLIMDDYFGSFDSSLSSLLTGLRASGDTHPIAIENYPETSSRFDLSTNGSLSWGASNTQWSFGYSYDCTYLCIEYMFAESSPLTPIYGDGYFYQGGSTYNGGNSENSANAFDHAMRQDIWWAIASGARGFNIGDESEWQWASTAASQVSTAWFASNNAGNIRAFVESLPGWQTLAPATGSTLITAGRGTRATQFSSGGGGGQYEIAFTNTYVAASRTPDTGSGSSLALLYLPTGAATITVDQTKLASGYLAYKVDPITGAKTSITAGSTYNPSGFGTNSQGGTDWVLLFQAPSGTTRNGAAALTGTGSLAATGAFAGAAALSGTGSLSVPGVMLGFSALLSGTGSVTAAGVFSAAGALSGTGTLAVPGVVLGFAAALAGSGTIAATGALAGSASLSGTGTLTVPGVTLGFSAPLAGTGTLTAAAVFAASGQLTGTGTLTAAGAVHGIANGAAALSGAGTIGLSGVVLGFSAALSGSGTISAAAVFTGAAALSGSGVLIVPGYVLGPSAPLSGTGALSAAAVFLAGAALAGLGVITATGTRIPGGKNITGAAVLSGAGVLTAAGAKILPGALALSGSGTLTAAGVLYVTVAAALSGTGVLGASAVFGSSAALAGSGTLAASPVLTVPASAALAGSGTLAAAASRAWHPAAALSGLGVLSALGQLAVPFPFTAVMAVSPLPPRWQAAPLAPRWAAAVFQPRWSVIAVQFKPIAAISVENIPVLWTAELAGTVQDPTGQTAGQSALPVQFAVPVSSGDVLRPAEPVTWYAASWLTGPDVNVAGYVQLCPVGPTGGSPAGLVQLTAGMVYDVWARIIASTEAPARFAGQQPVY